MKIRLSIVMLLLISFLNIGAVSDVKISTNSFNNLEVAELSKGEFEENGVKLQYKTKENIEKEELRIKKYLTNAFRGSYSRIDKNKFEISNRDYDINIKLWSEDKYTYVEIILVNTNHKYNTVILKNMLRKLENQKSENIQYFLYCECKIKQLDTKQILNELINESNIQKIDLLDINNGCTGTGYLSNGEKVNFALANYNTGSYIIIGTPIIFVTY